MSSSKNAIRIPYRLGKYPCCNSSPTCGVKEGGNYSYTSRKLEVTTN